MANIRLSLKSITEPFADIASLKGYDVTSVDEGVIVIVNDAASQGKKLFTFTSSTSLTSDDINVVTPSVGTGRWVANRNFGDITISGSSPILKTNNITAEDIDGGRESSNFYSGVKLDGTAHDLAKVVVCHDGAADDTKGKYLVYVNNGTSLTYAFGVSSAGLFNIAGLTVAGGIVQTDALGNISSSVTLPDGSLATTQAPGDNTTKLSTTAFVQAAVTAIDFWDRVTGTPNYLIPGTAADDIGATGARITKGWYTDLESTNAPTVSGAAVYYAGGADVAVADGGTGLSAYAVGDLIYASGTTTLSKLADEAIGRVLVSGGVGVAPLWSSSPQVSEIGIGAAAYYSPLYIYTNNQVAIRLQQSTTTANSNTIQFISKAGNTAYIGQSGTIFGSLIEQDALLLGTWSATKVGLIANQVVGLVIDDATNNVGLGGELTPVTSLEITRTDPYITTHNSTNEDTDGGRESLWIARGQQSGGEESILGKAEFSHYGPSDDEQGKFVLYLNDGNDGLSPTRVLSVLSNGYTAIGSVTPTAKFEVSGIPGLNLGLISVLDTRAYAQGVGGAIALRGVYNSVGGYAVFGYIAGGKENAVDGNYSGYLSLQTISNGGNAQEKIRISSDGKTLISPAGGAALTLLELRDTAPYLTFTNSTAEDGDGGRESRFIARGIQSGAEEHVLGQFEFSHHGTADDQTGRMLKSINLGADGTTPTSFDGFFNETIVDDGERALETSVTCVVEIFVEGSPEYMLAHVQDDGTTNILISQGSVDNTDSDGNLCLYDSGSGASIKNRLGSSKNIVWKIMYR